MPEPHARRRRGRGALTGARLRRAKTADAAAIAALHRRVRKACLPYLPDLHTPEEDRAYFRRVLSDCSVWVAEVEGLQGFVAARQGWIDHLYVDADHHRRGVGSALLNAAFPVCGRDARLWTFQRNIQARAFYKRHGFVCAELTNGARNEEREPDMLYLRTLTSG